MRRERKIDAGVGQAKAAPDAPAGATGESSFTRLAPLRPDLPPDAYVLTRVDSAELALRTYQATLSVSSACEFLRHVASELPAGAARTAVTHAADLNARGAGREHIAKVLGEAILSLREAGGIA